MLWVVMSHQTLTVGPVLLIEVMDDVCLQHLLHSNKHHTQKINNLPGKCILSISIILKHKSGIKCLAHIFIKTLRETLCIACKIKSNFDMKVLIIHKFTLISLPPKSHVYSLYTHWLKMIENFASNVTLQSMCAI